MARWLAASIPVGICLGDAPVRYGHPGDFPGWGAGRSQRSEYCPVGVGEQPPGGGRGGDRSECLALVPQHGRIRYHLTAVGEHHRESGGGPTWSARCLAVAAA